MSTTWTTAAQVAPPTIESGGKLPDNDHGNRFQSKLLFLFFIQAMNKSYEFHLGTELAKFGGKFDDLIFVKNFGQPNRQKSFLYLQAKHRLQKPNMKPKNIKITNLLNDNKGDFSLMKYFHSYRDDIMKAKDGPQSNEKVDCVICTNIDFDKEDLADNGIIKNGIKLVTVSSDKLNELPREMLTFKPIQRSIAKEKKLKKGSENKETNEGKDKQKYYKIANFFLQLATNTVYEARKQQDVNNKMTHSNVIRLR